MTPQLPSLLADLVSSRGLSSAFLLAGAAQIVLVSLGYPGWPCVFREAVGLPCPGCGLSRAAVALLAGDWPKAFAFHPFVGLVPVFLALLAVGALAPARVREASASALARIEARVPIALIAATAFIAFGLIRLAVSVVPLVERSLLGVAS